jgi:hypothetical protein
MQSWVVTSLGSEGSERGEVVRRGIRGEWSGDLEALFYLGRRCAQMGRGGEGAWEPWRIVGRWQMARAHAWRTWETGEACTRASPCTCARGPGGRTVSRTPGDGCRMCMLCATGSHSRQQPKW